MWFHALRGGTNRPSSPFLHAPARANVALLISQPMSEVAQTLTGIGADDPREMALIGKSKIG